MQVLFAQAVASAEPGLAMELMKTWQNRQGQDNGALISIVYRAGARHPDEALKIVAEMNDDLPQQKSAALGWLAVALAKRDPKRAAALIDQALASWTNPVSGPRSWSGSGGPAEEAARIALLARRIGYPDTGSVIARVLATRRRPGGVRGGGDLYSGSMASLLALIDPAVSREALVQAEAGAGSMLSPKDRPDASSFQGHRIKIGGLGRMANSAFGGKLNLCGTSSHLFTMFVVAFVLDNKYNVYVR